MFLHLAPPIIVFVIFYFIYKMLELFARRNERMTMIEKLNIGDGADIPPDISKLFTPPTPASWALRLGLLLMGIGLGLCLAIIMDYEMDFSGNSEAFYFASMMLFGGLGLVIAYIIEQKQKKQE